MKKNCELCGVANKPWVSGETFDGLHEHHNPPQYMLKPWKGELLTLCRKDHESIHRDLILPHLNKIAGTLKPIKSESWIWTRLLTEIQKDSIPNEIFKETKRWLND